MAPLFRIAFVLAPGMASVAHAQNFLHFAPNGTSLGSVRSMSADGSVVTRGFGLWFADNSFQQIPGLGTASRVYGISDDGRYAVFNTLSGSFTRGGRFDRVSQTSYLVAAPGNAPFYGISPSGNSIGGGLVNPNIPGGRRPALALDGSPSISVPDPTGPAGDFWDISADETVAVGWAVAGVPLRWQAGGPVQVLPGGPGFAWAVSSDGVRTAGQANGQAGYWQADVNGQQVFTTIDTSMVPAPTGAINISPDGRFIVGGEAFGVANAGVDAGFIWSMETGTRRVSELLAAAGFDVQGYRFSEVRAVSADGKTFAGLAFNPSNQSVGFYARIPAPSTAFAVAMGSMLAVHRRRRIASNPEAATNPNVPGVGTVV